MDSKFDQASSSSSASTKLVVCAFVHFLFCRWGLDWVGVGVLVGNTVGGAVDWDGEGDEGGGGGSVEGWVGFPGGLGEGVGVVLGCLGRGLWWKLGGKNLQGPRSVERLTQAWP